MIVFTFINLGLKYLYDSILDDLNEEKAYLTQFVDFSNYFFFYEFLAIFDSLIIYMMSLSIIKYTFFWIPSLSIIILSLEKYSNSTVKRIILYILTLSFMYSVYCHIINAYIAYDFRSYIFSWMRSNILFLDGNLFNDNLVFLSNEN